MMEFLSVKKIRYFGVAVVCFLMYCISVYAVKSDYFASSYMALILKWAGCFFLAVSAPFFVTAVVSLFAAKSTDARIFYIFLVFCLATAAVILYYKRPYDYDIFSMIAVAAGLYADTVIYCVIEDN